MPPLIAPVVRAAIRLRSGARDAARAEVDGLDPSLPHGAINALATLAEVVAEVGPDELARTLIARLQSFADANAAWGLFGLSCGPPIAASLGRLHARLGEREPATALFESAIARTTASGTRALRVWSRYAYARALDEFGAAERARALLDEVASEAAELGMGLADRCRAPAVPEVSASDCSLRPHAGAWMFERGETHVLLPNLRGMPMLARLLACPDVEIHSLELVSGREDTRAAGGDAGELIDGRARAEYRRRAAELGERIEEAEAHGDSAAANAARSERDRLEAELRRALGLGGRSRRAGSAAERARISAQRRIREAIRRVGEADAELGAYLDRTIRTGLFCIYQPSRRSR
jgi:hypothetical protein